MTPLSQLIYLHELRLQYHIIKTNHARIVIDFQDIYTSLD